MAKSNKIITSALLLIVIGSSFYAVSRTQDIADWLRLRNYQPSQEIISLADVSTMTDYGRKLFYVHDPELLSREQFRESCTVGEETIVLGCYISNQRIFLYDINDKRLEGIEEVTAAHEMLHAAYDRLEPSKKDEINQLLEDTYSLIDDKRLQKTIDSYKKRDPSVVTNELHSILGTEVKNLPKDLENYYAQYFLDRMKIVELAEDYEEEFQKREDKIEEYDSKLSVLNGEIARLEAEINVEGDALTQERTLLEQLRKNPEQFNNGVDSYNSKVAIYNQKLLSAKELIEEYNEIVVARNKIAVEERELVEAIDTRAPSTVN